MNMGDRVSSDNGSLVQIQVVSKWLVLGYVIFYEKY